MLSKKKLLIITFAIIGVLASALFVGVISSQIVSAQGNYEDLRTFVDVLNVIKKNYVDEVKTKDLVSGAIKGMLASLDPHSGYMTAEAFKEFQVETKGEFGGLGIQISIKDGILTVIAPIEDTPAYKAGVKAGDKILKIDGESTKNMNIQDAVTKMRGPKGKPVTLNIFREGWTEPKDIAIVRDIIKIKSVKQKMLKGDIGYVKLTQFQEMTSDDLAKALKDLKGKGMKSIILDLRNDPGGLLNSAVDVAGQFLPAKKLVVYIKGRTGDKVEYFTEGDEVSYTDLPMVVLVNQGSASASEIVAGALKDWNRAVVVGVQTFGKGSVQTLIPLSDGSGLRLTTAKYYTPSGVSIQNVGITPDIVVKLEAKDGKGISVVREKDLEGHLENEKNLQAPDDEDKVPLEVSEKDDLQLQRAIDALKTWEVIDKLKKKAA
ncbi:MAG TPA: S41 family peptidase [Dissulfurispiraceae bacterium]|nr:S41 family peptidase [Dissulfurispiraceae bacterium]